MQCMDRSIRKRVIGTDAQKEAEAVVQDKRERAGRTREKHRYQLAEDENSIYEYDIGCLNEKRRR